MILTFAHLIELRMVNLFRRRHGVSMPVIKATAQRLAERFNTVHPFSSVRIMTDGKAIFAESDTREFVRYVEEQNDEKVNKDTILEDIAKMQMVMRDIVRVYLHDTEYDMEMASRWWLLGTKEERAVLDPRRAWGQPIDGPSGVPLSALYKLVTAGETVESVADWYEVDIKAVEAAISFYSSLMPVVRDVTPKRKGYPKL